MVSSMTGFGRSEAVDSEGKITVEIKSVNHRYLDISVKMPRSLTMFEPGIRNLVKENVERGKIDIFINYESYNDSSNAVRYNKNLAGEYYKALLEMKEDFGFSDFIRLSELSRFPEVLSLEEQAIDEDALFRRLSSVISEAFKALKATRQHEGERLKEDLMAKLSHMSDYVADIERHAPEIVSAYRDKITEKVNALLEGSGIDESRIVTETAIFADKIAVDEEIVRLRSHIKAMQKTLSDGGCIGRKLDFLAQEMNREANTILSKSGDLITTDNAIELKTDIEKIREQIQNIE
ncbi:MAG: YicC family protein [Lachnospiraceae bacterium]|nr:YicC family protein [Lachnospiraceae bacterium]